MSLLKRIEALENKSKLNGIRHIDDNSSRMIVHSTDKPMIYVPNNTGKLFHADDSFVRLEMGPYGSGKTTTCLTEIVKRACAMPAWYAGRRKAKWAIIRNTTGELESTTLQSWLMWFGDLECVTAHKKPFIRHEYLFNDGNGLIELELIFLPLDRPDQVKKIKSFELTGAYINELSEVPKAAFEHLTGRVNRYPSKAFCQLPYWSGIIADTNPPDEDHWIYNDFERNPVPGYKLFKQPPALIKDANGEWAHNPKADNIEHLPETYYINLAKGKNEQFVNVFCLGKYGLVSTGKLVYPEYNDDIHSVENLEYFPNLPINLGFDGGLTPSCTVSQFTSRGQFRLLKEYCAEDMGIRTFVESVVLPGLNRDFPNWKLGFARSDPACSHRDAILEEMSVLGEINSLGIKCEDARTNDIPPRLAAVRFFLNRMVDGHPGFILSRTGCPITRKGFVRDYVYKRLSIANEERFREVPDKNYTSHPHDTVQYQCLEFAADHIAKERAPEVKVDVWNPGVRVFN